MDVSGHQTTAQVSMLAAADVNAYVIVKATEGQTWKAASYPVQRDTSGAKFLGAYHFAWTNQDPIVEADNFLGHAALKVGELAFLDMERSTAGESWETRVAYLLAWCDHVNARTGATPLVYVNWSWIKGLRTAATVEQWERIVAYPLWLAQWTNVAGKFDAVSPKSGSDKGWPVLLHQYGVVDGIDRNWTPDLAALRACAVTRLP